MKVEMAPGLPVPNVPHGFRGRGRGRKATLNLMCFRASGLVRLFVALTVTVIGLVDTDCLAPW